MTLRSTPAALGFRLPAEWEPHEATWLSWPHKEASWPGAFAPIPALFAEITRHLAESELVRINVADAEVAADVRRLLQRHPVDLSRIRFHHHPTDDAWCRDHGAIYVVREVNGRRERAITDWDYNAWGGKYPPFAQDNAIPQRIAAEFGEQRFVPGMVLEGGSIDVNGCGDLLTTEGCLLHANRNPTLTRAQIEDRLRQYLGVQRIHWLGEGIGGDDTDGHVDDLTRFVTANTIVTMVEADRTDENHAALQENFDRLQHLRTAAGQRFQIIPLQMPEPAFFQGQRLPASYANFYIANTRVLVPIFHTRHDAAALETLQRIFPTRKVVGIHCSELVWGLGAIHCITHEQPAGEISVEQK